MELDWCAEGLADLHRHLDGSLRRSTLIELARIEGADIPTDIRFFVGMGLQGALACFRHTLSVLQKPASVQRVAAEICEDAAGEGVETLEIRFAPHLHKGASLEAIVDAALAGINGRAGLLLCGLYGDDPSLLEALVNLGRTRSGVVGIDLAGGPSSGHSFCLSDYAAPFSQARDCGLGRTVHAAEGRSPSEIRTAIEELGAQRIGHGTTLLEDPAVLELVLEHNVVIEACPTSNVHTGVIATVAEHPLKRWLDLGVRATICTDNTLLSDVDAPTEHTRCLAIPNMTTEDLARAARFGREAAFGASR